MSRTISKFTAMLCVVAFAGIAFAATPEDAAKKAAATAAPAKADPAHDAMVQAAMPGKQHEGFKSLAGKWKTVTKGWYGPGEPTVTEGTSENTLILDGRFVRQDFHGSMMGQPFEGIGYTGYDNMAKAFTMVWMDNSTTMIISATNGVMDEATKTLTFTSKIPGADGKLADCRMVTKAVSDNEHVFTLYTSTPQGEHKMMEITYTRM